jgi:RIP metalloprotease RseP
VQLISNFGQTAAQVAGPVKIVEIGASIAQSDAGNLFQFAALISINLAIINILPLPALDGGQLAFLLIEGLRGNHCPQTFKKVLCKLG